jgi:hypothetical protein
MDYIIEIARRKICIVAYPLCIFYIDESEEAATIKTLSNNINI